MIEGRLSVGVLSIDSAGVRIFPVGIFKSLFASLSCRKGIAVVGVRAPKLTGGSNMGTTGVAAGILLPVYIASSSFFVFHFFRTLRSGGKDVLLSDF